MTKQEILDAIVRTTSANGGKPLGFKSFEQQTGVRYQDWFGKHWKAWGDALSEAGFQPNTLQGRLGDNHLLEQYAGLIRELGRVPVKGDLLLKRSRDSTFPSDKVFGRYGSKAEVVARVREFCLERPDFSDVLPLISVASIQSQGLSVEIAPMVLGTGYVYLLKHGSRRQYKIGKTNNPIRREGEIGIQLPESIQPLHYIETDDPSGIERYWHSRFSAKRLKGEWFALSEDDVRAFKRWRRIV